MYVYVKIYMDFPFWCCSPRRPGPAGLCWEGRLGCCRAISTAPRIPPGRIAALSCLCPRELFGHLGSAFPPSEPAGSATSLAVETWGPLWGPWRVRGGRLEGPRAPKTIPKFLGESLERPWGVLGGLLGWFWRSGVLLGSVLGGQNVVISWVLDCFL